MAKRTHDNTDLSDLTPVEKAAVFGAVKGGDLKAAKAETPRGTTPVRFAVEISGTVTAKQDTPGHTNKVPAVVDLGTRGVMLAVLAEIGIGTKRFGDALAAITPRLAVPADTATLGEGLDKLEAVLALAEAAAAERMGPQPKTTNAKAGAVSADVELRRIELPPNLRLAS